MYHLRVSHDVYLALKAAKLLRSFRLYSHGEFVDGIPKLNGTVRVWLKEDQCMENFQPNFIPEEKGS